MAKDARYVLAASTRMSRYFTVNAEEMITKIGTFLVGFVLMILLPISAASADVWRLDATFAPYSFTIIYNDIDSDTNLSVDEQISVSLSWDTLVNRVAYVPFVVGISNSSIDPTSAFFSECNQWASSDANWCFTSPTYTVKLDYTIYPVTSYTKTKLSSVPLPAALPLFSSGLGVMGLLVWRRKRKKAAAMVAA